MIGRLGTPPHPDRRLVTPAHDSSATQPRALEASTNGVFAGGGSLCPGIPGLLDLCKVEVVPEDSALVVLGATAGVHGGHTKVHPHLCLHLRVALHHSISMARRLDRRRYVHQVN